MKKTRLLNKWIAITPLCLPIISFSSCSNVPVTNNFRYVSKSSNYCFNNENIVTFKCQYFGFDQINKINSIELITNDNLLELSGKTTNIPVDGNGYFSFSVNFKETHTETVTALFSVKLTYINGNEETAQTVSDSNFSLIYDVHSISLDESQTVFEQKGNEVTCHLLFSGFNIPLKIDHCELSSGMEYFDFPEGQDNIPVGDNGSFKIKLIKKELFKNYSIEQLSFSIKIQYKINDLQLSHTSDNLLCSFYNTHIERISYSKRYLFTVGETFLLNLKIDADGQIPSKIDKVYFQDEENYLDLVHDSDISVDNTGCFSIEIKWNRALGESISEHTFSLLFDYAINGSQVFSASSDTPFTINLIRAPDYEDDCVSIFPVDDGTLRFSSSDSTHGDERIDNLNIKYKIGEDDSWHDYKHDTQDIEMVQGQPIFINAEPNDCSWSTDEFKCWIDVDNTPFVLGGNASTLIKREGFTSFDVLTKKPYALKSLFEGEHVLFVKPNFLPMNNVPEHGYMRMFYACEWLTSAPYLDANQISEASYFCMFEGCKNLLFGPNNLPSENVPTEAYYKMFSGCELLSNEMVLYFKTVEQNSLAYFLENCKNIAQIRLTNYIDDFDIYPRSRPFMSWVDGVAENGSFFYKGSDRMRGPNAIPENWTIIDS